MSMYINPLHRDQPIESITDYEESIAPPRSPHIMMDPELYVRASNDAGEGATYAVPFDGSATVPDYIEFAGDTPDSAPASYALFRSTPTQIPSVVT